MVGQSKKEKSNVECLGAWLVLHRAVWLFPRSLLVVVVLHFGFDLLWGFCTFECPFFGYSSSRAVFSPVSRFV